MVNGKIKLKYYFIENAFSGKPSRSPHSWFENRPDFNQAEHYN